MKIPKQINVKTALIFVGISILLTSLFFYAFAATPSSTFYISSGVYPGAPSYTIWKEGANYFAKDVNGMLKYSGTNASQIITNCIANNIHIKIKQDFVGNIWITNTIVIPSGTKYVTFEGDGHVEAVDVLGGLKLTDGANCDMFAVEAGCHQIHFVNLGLHGNKAGQTSTSNGIRFTGSISDCRIERCSIVGFKTHCVYVEGSLSASYFLNNYLEDSCGDCINAEGLINSVISNNILWSCRWAIFLNSTTLACQDNTIIGNKISHQWYGGSGGGIYIYNSTGNDIIGNWIDDSMIGIHLVDSYRGVINGNNIRMSRQHGIWIYHCQYLIVSDNFIVGAGCGTSTPTYDGIYVAGTGHGTHYCTLSGNMITAVDITNKTRYGINEEGGCDWNIYSNIYATGCSNKNITITGSNGYILDSYNGTEWISSYSPS